MKAKKAVKLGFGTFFSILGLYLIFKFQGDMGSVIGGIFCIALGIGLIASN